VFIEKQDDVSGLNFDEQRTKDLMMKYVQDADQGDRRSTERCLVSSSSLAMSQQAFLRYLMSSDNLVFDPSKLDLFMDMDRPLSHYFISSSHNTYLIGSQFTGRASVEMYRQVLLTGCRCIELDVVDSERIINEPEIKHKNTPIRTVPFIEVIVAIRDYAFKVTPYPLILSLENHCRSME
jgi:phosphatidylinositol phospholipase C, beta